MTLGAPTAPAAAPATPLFPTPHPTRDQLAAQMAALPPPSSVMTADDQAFILANADLVRDDWAEAGAELVDATNVGKRRKLMRYGIGAVVGVAVGALAYKLIGGL